MRTGTFDPPADIRVVDDVRPSRVDRRGAWLGAATGTLAVLAILVIGGRVGSVPGARPVSTWFGLLAGTSALTRGSLAPGLLLIPAVAGLALSWLAVLRAAQGGVVGTRWLGGLGALWSGLFLIGPPLFSSDSYSYAAQGLLVLHGFDPYHVGPAALGHAAAAAVDPRWRDTVTPYGPVALHTEHFAAWLGHGSPLATLLIMRAITYAAMVGAAALVLRVTSRANRPVVLTYLLLSPLVLLHIASAGHLEALLALALAGALLAARRGAWTLAIVAATVAFMTKAPILPAVFAIGWAHAAGIPSMGRRIRAIATDTAAFAVTAFGLAASVPDGWGFLRALGTPGLTLTPAAPTSLFFRLLVALRNAGLVLPSDNILLTFARITGLTVGGVLCIALAATASRRPLAATVGLCMMSLALLAPVLYPWYLLWGLVPLAMVFTRYRAVLTVGMGLGPLLAMPGLTFGPLAPIGVATTALVFLAVAFGPGIRRRRQAEHALSSPAPRRRLVTGEPAPEGGPVGVSTYRSTQLTRSPRGRG